MEVYDVPEAQMSESSLMDHVFSWSIEDILNDDLYKHKVKEIPNTFTSISSYMSSFTLPLIEETRADLCSSIKKVSTAPVYEILEIKVAEPPKKMLYAIKVRQNKDIHMDAEKYEPWGEDLIAITDVRPTCTNDLTRPTGSLVVALVQRVINEQDNIVLHITSSKLIELEQYMRQNLNNGVFFAVFLSNAKTNIRIWKALKCHPDRKNMRIINKVLQHDSAVKARCAICLKEGNYRMAVSDLGHLVRPFSLNESQAEAVSNSFATKSCYHDNAVNLIWGPPGTGKTKTVAVLLYALLREKCRTVTCAPTNVAVLEVAARILGLVTESIGCGNFRLGDIVLFGSKKRMKIDDSSDLLNIFLDYRAKILAQCYAPKSGWKNCLASLICLLENPEEQYHVYLRNENDEVDKESESDGDEEEVELVEGMRAQRSVKYKGKIIWREVIAETMRRNLKKINLNSKAPTEQKNQSKFGRENWVNHSQLQGKMSFDDFFRGRFNSKRRFMKLCAVNLVTHVPTSYISEEEVKNMIRTLNLLEHLETFLYSDSVNAIGLKEVLVKNEGHSVKGYDVFKKVREECLQLLTSLHEGIFIPNFFDESSIKMLCLQNACLFFCTASSSVKLHTTSAELLIVDEAAQLKECESIIPLQLPGLRHAVLIGDEKQLPALIRSKISEEAGLGRSLFERLVLLGYKKTLLNLQYRMHPSISLFPNKEFYQKQISDAPNVRHKNHQRTFLQGDMYGSYSFINVGFGEEEISDGHSMKNSVEVAVVSEVVANLFKEFLASKQKLSVGVISPYNAQVFAIRETLGTRYSTDVNSNFSVSVRSIDGFQGGEEDVIIISTVRCNGNGSVGFLSNRQRANVALTRARHCLWIFGNEPTLRNSGSVWKKLITDAKIRGCAYNAHEDKRLAKAIVAALVDADPHPLDISLDIKSLLFEESRWKVCFHPDFWASMSIIKNIEVRKEVLSVLTKLSCGLRWHSNDEGLYVMDRNCAQLLEVYKVKDLHYIVWSVELVKEQSNFVQVLKFWDISPHSEMPNLLKKLDYLFGSYTLDLMHLCKFKQMDGLLEVPMTWPVNSDVGRRIRLPGADPLQNLCSQFSSLGFSDD